MNNINEIVCFLSALKNENHYVRTPPKPGAILTNKMHCQKDFIIIIIKILFYNNFNKTVLIIANYI